MLNSLVNLHDFVVLYEKIRARGARSIAGKLFSGRAKRVADSWQHTEGCSSFWWDIPLVRERWNKLITGDKTIDPASYVLGKYLKNSPHLSGMSLGCGSGNRELGWAEKCPGLHLVGYDVSAERILEARNKAKNKGLASRVEFIVADVGKIDFPARAYDVVFAESSLHHFSPLERIIGNIKKALKDGGLFIVDEFVGPSRFQWTDKQLEIANNVLRRLPEEYRRRYGDGGRMKSKVYRPGRLSMFLNDPSEAAESDRIPGLLQETFRVLEAKKYGGTVLNPLFKDIAHNFLDGSAATVKLLEICFEAEDRGMALHEIQSDFMFFVCAK